MRILFISPHPDDIEFACGNTETRFIEDGHEVYIACITADEYGTDRNDYKGERISKIRRREMKRAAEIIGITKLDWLGFIDGYVKINKKSINYIKKYIKKINPDIIFTSDPFYPVDFHPDHLKTGFMVLSILKKMKNPPLTLLFYTFCPNYYIPCIYRKKAFKAFSMHRSQGFDRKITILFNSIFQLIHGLKIQNFLFADAYRIVDLTKRLKIKNSLWNKMKYAFFNSIMKILLPKAPLYNPTPEDLGIKEFRF
ncbi:MAG: hypothetical protein GF329_21610 [Candidatus Lokiarchaeota archaeon]|nr:hypothetical protein [Candidatus Lokiarchaeota archaeon]